MLRDALRGLWQGTGQGPKFQLARVEGQVMVIVGATSGIGLATARLAAARRARLVLAGRNQAALGKIAQELGALTQVTTVPTDVTDEAAVTALAEAAVTAYGRIDTWVQVAGVSIYGALDEVPLADQHQVMDTNFWGVVHGCRAALTAMRATATTARGASLVVVGSVLSDRAIPLQGIYCASKHAVKAWTDALRMEVQHDGLPVQVTLIKPAAIDTPYVWHAKNYLEHAPQNPPPVYAPAVVARAIMHAAEVRARTVTVGGGGFIIALIGDLLPGLTDRVMQATLWTAQQTLKPKESVAQASTKGRKKQGTLASHDDALEHGRYEGRVRQSSLFTRGQMLLQRLWARHPRAMTVGAAVLVLLILL